MNKLINWTKRQNEYSMLIIGLLLFYYSPYFFRWLDPTAGTYDIGVLQINITAVISFCIFQSVVWATLKINWLPIRCHFEDYFTGQFKNLEPWQKIVISLSVYFLLLYALVLLNQAVPAIPTAPAIK